MPVVVIILMIPMDQDGRKQQEPPSAVTLQYMCVGIETPASACVISYEL